MTAPQPQANVAHHRIRSVLARGLRGIAVAFIGFVVSGLSVEILRSPFNYASGPDGMTWCMLGTVFGFILGCLMPSNRLGPRTEIVVSSILIGTILGSLIISSWGIISAAQVKAVTNIHGGSKLDPSVLFDRVAIVWGYFAGMGIGVCVACGRLSKKIGRHAWFTFAAILATVSVFSVQHEFANIKQSYVERFK